LIKAIVGILQSGTFLMLWELRKCIFNCSFSGADSCWALGRCMHLKQQMKMRSL